MLNKNTDTQNGILKLSVSKSKTFEQCQKKFYYSYVQKLPRKEFEFHIFGKMVHKILEDFHRAYLNGEKLSPSQIMRTVFNNVLKEYKGKYTEEHKKEAIGLMGRYLEMISQDKTIISNVISVEDNFSINIGSVQKLINNDNQKINIILNGMIDKIIKDDDNILHVIDYKTTKSKQFLKDDFIQLLTYAYVIYLQNPEITKVRGSYVLLRHNFEYITKEFTLEEILSVKDIYKEYAKEIENTIEYSYNPTILCKYCDYNNICPEYNKNKEKQTNGKSIW